MLAIIYVILLLLAPLLERVMMFPASLLPKAEPQAPVEQGVEALTLKTADGVAIRGLFYLAPGRGKAGELPPTILYFYGNGATAGTSTYEVELLRSAGANVLVVDYPGYGSSDGKPSERGLYQSADALWEYTLHDTRIDPRRIVAVGWSLGGAVAIDTAIRHPVAGLMTLSTFTDMHDMARVRMPILPTDLLLSNHFHSFTKAQLIQAPYVILHGTEDANVPFYMAGELRSAAVKAPLVVYEPVPGAGHNDIFPIAHRQISAHIRHLLDLAGPRGSSVSVGN